MQSSIYKSDIKMVDLYKQYLNIKNEIDTAVQETISSSRFIGGKAVKNFEFNLSQYLQTDHVISCGNGTDALQIALMALDLQKGDEVIVPAFTYVATAEVIALLGLIPVMIDVHKDSFNIKLEDADKLITKKTKAIIPVHLFGQSADMTAVINFAKRYNLFVIEDNAQAIGASFIHEGKNVRTGTLGHIGTYSFFPSKNLGCYGDGGALSTDDEVLANRIRMIASHGQSKKYYHEVVGVNSRLDSMQAAILDVKLRYLNGYIDKRKTVANFYDRSLADLEWITLPIRSENCIHVFHQYTIQVSSNKRDELKEFLSKNGIPSMVYYPLPLYKQVAYQNYVKSGFLLNNTEHLCKTVLSLPMHTELTQEDLNFIVDKIKSF